jgi:hypothetical protein
VNTSMDEFVVSIGHRQNECRVVFAGNLNERGLDRLSEALDVCIEAMPPRLTIDLGCSLATIPSSPKRGEVHEPRAPPFRNKAVGAVVTPVTSPVATSSTSSRSTFAITTDSVLTVRCSFTPRSTESSRGHHLPWAQGWIGEIDLAGCCTSITGRQHDGPEFVHRSASERTQSQKDPG